MKSYIRIEPDWNVKRSMSIVLFDFKRIRIEPDWNVKLFSLMCL